MTTTHGIAEATPKRPDVTPWRVPKRARDSLKKGINDIVVPFIKRVEEHRRIKGGERIRIR